IGMVHQHFMLVPTLTVVENLVLGRYSSYQPLFHLPKVEEEVAALAARYGLKVDPKARVGRLSVGTQQRVEILKALYRGAQLLILDEPTAVLTPQEMRDLFKTLSVLTQQGLAVIFITHKLDEVMAVSQRVTVLRDGRVVSTLFTKDTSKPELARLMVGREMSLEVQRPPQEPGQVLLKIEGLEARDELGLPALQGIDLEVHSGEIVGIAGVDGNGQRELAQILTGVLHPSRGHILLNGQDITGRSASHLLKLGVANIPADRHSEGLVMEFSLADNTVLKDHGQPPFSSYGVLLNNERISEHARTIVERFAVRATSVKAPVRKLSGGNQQKVVLGRELSREPTLLVASQPTRGLDIGATKYVHENLLAQRARGAGILLISTELEEVLALSDRVAVIHDGHIMGVLEDDRSNLEQIGLMMAGERLPVAG
ncbi:MAG: ABC transporter ATP-binding protein, partial [Deinococcus sp.]|nr:ABC transporter ATP-binding protein [Deinococcus sp.]